jgi:hypothetical protein
MLIISRELGNAEFSEFVNQGMNSDLSITNVIDCVAFRSEMGGDVSAEIAFLSRFSGLEDPSAALRQLSVWIISEVLSSPSLEVKSEDRLYDFVASRILDDNESFSLLENVRFEYLSAPKFRK